MQWSLKMKMLSLNLKVASPSDKKVVVNDVGDGFYLSCFIQTNRVFDGEFLNKLT